LLRLNVRLVPILAWLTLALLVADVLVRRSSEQARQAHANARFPLWRLALPAVACWVVLMFAEQAWPLQAALFVIQLVLVIVAVRRYATLMMVLPLSGVLLLWSGGIAWKQFTRRPVTVGHRSGMDGGFSQSVSAQFKKPELERFYARLMQIDSRGELQPFTCGDPPPRMEFELTLKPEGTWNERLVSVGYSPQIDNNTNRCLSSGLSYVVAGALAEVDHGPPIDYGYTDPLSGKKTGPYVYGPRQAPICLCELRHSGREWVAFTEEAAAELRAKASESPRPQP